MRRYLLAMLASLTLLVAGCSSENPDTPGPGKEEPGLEFSVIADKNVTLQAEGGSFTIKLTSPCSWEISLLNDRAKDWISFSKPSGSKGNHEVTVYVEENKEYDTREATVRVKTSNGDSHDIMVSQKCRDALTVSASRNDFPADAGTLTVSVKANIDFACEIAADCRDWISEVSTRAMTTTELTFAIAENKRTSARSGSILITSSKGTETIRVNQAALVPSLVVSSTQIPMPYGGGAFSVDVTSNMDATVTVNDSWIHETQTKATSTNTFSFSVDAYSGQESRKGTVTFAVEGLAQTVTVEQLPETALVISLSEYTADAAGELISVTASSNQNVNVTVSESWLSIVNTRAMTDTLITISVSQNTSLAGRTGNVIFTSGDGTKTQTLAIRQNGETPKLWADQDVVCVRWEGGTASALIMGNVEFGTEIIGNEDGWFNIDISDAASADAAHCKKVSVSCGIVDAGNVFRNCFVKFSNAGLGISGMLEIQQDIRGGIVLLERGKAVPKEGGQFAIRLVKSQDAIEDVILPSWISRVETRAVTSGTLYVKVDPTPFSLGRKGTITFIGAEGFNQYFEVDQEGDETKGTVVPDDKIWYTCSGDHILDFSKALHIPFDQEILSVTYENGMGKVKLAGPVKSVMDYAFSDSNHAFLDGSYVSQMIQDVYLPDCVENIGTSAFAGCRMKSFIVPASLKTLSNEVFYSSGIERFIGNNTTADGKGIVLDGTFYAFAPAANDETYTIPADIVAIARSAFAFHPSLKGIVLQEGIRIIGQDAFSDCSLEEVTLPSTVEQIGYRAFGNNPVRCFRGNSGFISPDGLFLMEKDPYSDGSYISIFANGSGVESYSIPEGITRIQSYAFQNNKTLKYLTFPSTFRAIQPESFNGATALRGVFGPCASPDNRSVVVDGELQYLVPFGINHYYVDESVTRISAVSMQGAEDLESIVFNDGITTIGNYAFAHNRKLKSVVLPASLANIGYDPFIGCKSLTDVWVRSVYPPNIAGIYRNQESSSLVFHVPSESVDLYKNNVYWKEYADIIEGYDYDDLPGSTSEYYSSTDFSADGRVKTLRKASQGKGINLVLMGDGYTDAMIADGTYDAAIKRMYDVLFVEEPYKSLSDRFNVYQVDVVSRNGLIASGAITALNSTFAGGTMINGNNDAVIEYAEKAVGNVDDAVLIVIVNEHNLLGGTCHMYDGKQGQYGSGLAVCYFSDVQDDNLFSGVVNHEAMGHGFAKLADEYAYEYMGTYVPDADLDYREMMGWFKNVDVDGNPSSVKWAGFLADDRYSDEGIGIFEGAFTYWKGVYRPTEYSIMRYNDGGFNAPSREAIWCRIQYLSNGPSWEYDHEDFVTFDLACRQESAAPSSGTRSVTCILAPAEHCPPVFMGRR